MTKRSLYDLVWSRYGHKGESEDFIKDLRSRMKTHGIIQADLARRSGLHEPHISRWLNGKTDPTLETKLILDEAVDALIEEAKS